MVKLVVRLVGVEPGDFQDLDYPKHGSQSNHNNVDSGLYKYENKFV